MERERGEGVFLRTLSKDLGIIFEVGGDRVDMIFLEWVAALYVGVFGGGGGRVSEGEGEGIFLRKLSEDLSFCSIASLEGMGFKVDGDENRGVVGF